MTKEGILQVAGSETEPDITHITLHGKVYKINNQTREDVRKLLTDFFNSDAEIARIKDTSNSISEIRKTINPMPKAKKAKNV